MKNLGCESKVLFALVSLALTSACSDGGSLRPETEAQDLSVAIWSQMLSAETGEGVYREALTPELNAQLNADTELLSPLIPVGYPKPYLPYGRLANQRLDPGLSRMPFLNEDLVSLGKTLFTERLLSFSDEHGFSRDTGMACASCHIASTALTDQKSLSPGIGGELTHRNTPTLWNSAYYSTLTWSNPNFPILEMQAKIPLFNNDPIELGLRGKEKDLVEALAREEIYPPLFAKAFGIDLAAGVRSGTADYTMVTTALAAYERTLIRFDSPFDLFLQDKGRLSNAERLGAALFYGQSSLRSGETLNCASCHSGVLMSDSFQYVRDGVFLSQVVFHKDIRTPGLRLVGETAPYFHDGSAGTLDAVLDFYEKGGRDSPLQPAFSLSETEREALKAFFRSL